MIDMNTAAALFAGVLTMGVPWLRGLLVVMVACVGIWARGDVQANARQVLELLRPRK